MNAFALWRTAFTHRLTRLPVVTLMPHSRCNCRCVMCDIWKANRNGVSIGEETVTRLVADFRDLDVSRVVLSGGEALMHPNLWTLCEAIKTLPIEITLLSSGLLLARHADEIVRWCDEVIVSLDGAEPVHNRIRGIANAYGALASGVAALRRAQPKYRVSARCVVQRSNFRELPEIVISARSIGLDSISFLAADLSSTAFNRPEAWSDERTEEVGLSASESAEFGALVEQLIESRRADFAARFILESPARMRRIAAYFRAAHGIGPLPKVACNAPWVSAVIEADGVVRPCFFHAPIGRLGEGDGLPEILNSPRARAFRETLDMRRDPICSRCVCTLKL